MGVNYFRTRKYKFVKHVLPVILLGLLFIYSFVDYLIYYVIQGTCNWPSLNKDTYQPVYALVLADPHLLGSRNGHWFDRWRRERQMTRAFQTAITLHQPELVFILGDIFDEGKWCSDNEFEDYLQRFNSTFHVPQATQMYVVVGNHDIGFHYRITPHLLQRFEKNMSSPPVSLVSLRGNHFVLINSMALEGDGCSFCNRATHEIERIDDILKCSSGSILCKSGKKLDMYSQPIIMQHYPLYRESDAPCTGPDAAPLSIRSKLFEERWDCLSKESTEYLIESLHPRAAFGGHTHHSCVIMHSFVPRPDHKLEFVEYSVPSFSWRNRLNPKYYLLTASPEEVRVSKCSLPTEWSMKVTAILMLLALVLYVRHIYNTQTFVLKKWTNKRV